MPSRQVIEVLDDVTAPVQSEILVDTESVAVPGGEDNNKPVVGGDTAATDKKRVDKRKITPASDKRKVADSKKAKQQMNIASFFGKSNFPVTPHATANGVTKSNKAPSKAEPPKSQKKTKQPKSKQPAGKQPKTQEDQPLSQSPQDSSHEHSGSSVTHRTNSSKSQSPTVTGANSHSKGKVHNKMDFKDVIVGRLECRKSSSSIKALPRMETDADQTAAVVASSSGDHDDKLDVESMLPRIPSLSSVMTQRKKVSPTTEAKTMPAVNASSPTDNNIKSVPSRDDSEDSTNNTIGPLRSQLVRIFENPPPVEAGKEDVQNETAGLPQDGSMPPTNPPNYKPTQVVEAPGALRGNDIKSVSESMAMSEASVKPKDDTAETVEISNSQMKKEGEPAKQNDGLLEKRPNNAPDNASNKGQAKSGNAALKEDGDASSTSKSLPTGTDGTVAAMASKQSTELDPETQALLTQHKAMRTKYLLHATKVVNKGRDGLEEERISIDMPSTESVSIPSGPISDFPDAAVPHLVSLLEGSKLPLSELAEASCQALNTAFSETFSTEVVAEKIKVVAGRKPYIKNPAIAEGTTVSNNTSKDINGFEDANPGHMWRWEVILLELLPEKRGKDIKAARSARRKLQLEFNTTARLLGALDESIKLLEGPKTPVKTKIEKVVSKITREEQKLLKFEQEAEKARLLAEAKKQTQASKQQKGSEDTKKEEKQRLKEEKKRAAEEKKREKEEAKRKKALEREQIKKEKEAKELAEKMKKEQAEERQRKRMMSFFGCASKNPKGNNDHPSRKPDKPTEAIHKVCSVRDGFDVDGFRSNINSHVDILSFPQFESLSERAVSSCRPKVKKVKMRVFVSGQNADDPFGAPVFAEERLQTFRNRNKFLSFAEDCRPPYWGTWTKRSALNIGRKPFQKDPSLDYDVDSEAEWEEGDDDPGEDVENDADDEEEKMIDEEGDTRVYNYQDGWLAEDDDLGNEDADEDEATDKLLRESRKRKDNGLVPVCIVSPAGGGIPIFESRANDDLLLQDKVNGIPVQEARHLVSSHTATLLSDTEVMLDAFPPALVEEREGIAEPSNTQSNEPSQEDLRIIARFVHHSSIPSKPSVVEALRNAHPSVTASRAQAQRVLELIADKKKHKESGIYWEVKKDIIANLDLSDELKDKEHPEPKEAPKKESRKRKNSEGSNTAELKAKKSKTAAEGTSKSKGEQKKPKVSAASANLLAAFLGKKK